MWWAPTKSTTFFYAAPYTSAECLLLPEHFVMVMVIDCLWSCSFEQSGEFELKRIHAERHQLKDPCCEHEFADITYYLLIWRRPTFFLFNYIQPAVLINVLALFVFIIPAESGEKITLGISTMLNMIVFLMTIMDDLPPTEDIPIISVYYAFTMMLTSAATFLGVFSLRLHHNGQRGVPVSPRLR